MKNLFLNKYRIESARLKGYDYASHGFYFVTICTHNREHYFGHIENNTMCFSAIGQMADKFWHEIPTHFPHVKIDEFVVMSNHVHGIICITDTPVVTRHGVPVETQNSVPVETQNSVPVETQNGVPVETQNGVPVETQNFASLHGNKFGPQSKNLASIIRGYKSAVKKWATMNNIDFTWQSRFHDHIIRNDESLNRIRLYIQQNPQN